jgi:hypothetical protein
MTPAPVDNTLNICPCAGQHVGRRTHVQEEATSPNLLPNGRIPPERERRMTGT